MRFPSAASLGLVLLSVLAGMLVGAATIGVRNVSASTPEPTAPVSTAMLGDDRYLETVPAPKESTGGGDDNSPAPTTASIFGTVSASFDDGTSGPLSGVAVSLLRRDGSVAYQVTTNASGSYGIQNFAPGSYTLAVQRAGGGLRCGWTGDVFENGCSSRDFGVGRHSGGSISIPAPVPEPDPEETEPTPDPEPTSETP